ncbi:hypothetical protein A3B45_02745 [Candidatus Daviesbacteria bacterium RIFCSPLOWO2_01_FULL_39_12]|uniref:Uncharacterized protein n=1 Tax=Candidatus Daviesbacteria bacterium RIFCSPLOWO2_01_FULL_39_12 TaxID=1797785 RepID=A0A1F5KSM1_9BACT|nr:MAG: hypothetical protein A3D79_02475 [Candidatus Daviesbacteria bacterium RIFCSPHIGHO2_02_FULL_39_8]OGE43923.1 MAG: hypothetical protein A3B45_02745 [Candidatus Daviesbacteria bacterium RIFCSPLOWO2_01_FULL_39_12]
MNNLFIQIPGFGNIAGPTNLKPTFNNLASFLSALYQVAIFIAAFLAFYWLVWGTYQYIMARGNKEDLAKARSRIIWAIVGLLMVLLAYTLARFASEIFPPKAGFTPF